MSVTNWFDDLRVAIGFLTCVPVGRPVKPPDIARAYRLFPLVGAGIGCVVALVYLGLLRIDLPVMGAATLALGAGILLTGSLHEDGLADLADGFGGGADKAAKLAIMRDSRLGTYGALILVFSFAARLSALAALPHAAILPSLVAAHALARGALAPFAAMMPYARSDGLAVAAGRPRPAAAVVAVILALAVAFLALPWGAALASVVAVGIVATWIASLAMRQIDGQTGDVLGCVEQISEIAVLLLLAAWARGQALPL
jgi:adenosylcobinamide-GDP ribazoletransferase